MTIYVSKTKNSLLEKRKQYSNVDFSWMEKNKDFVDSFSYQGITFSYTSNMSHSVKCLQEKAHNNQVSFFGRMFVHVPLFSYGSEIWGSYSMSETDKLHIRFCKLV